MSDESLVARRAASTRSNETEQQGKEREKKTGQLGKAVLRRWWRPAVAVGRRMVQWDEWWSPE